MPFVRVDFGNRNRCIALTQKGGSRGFRNIVELFEQRVPALAPRTTANPLGHGRAALGATEDCSELGHGDTLRTERDTHRAETKGAAPKERHLTNREAESLSP